ncbi:MAG: hypothetical protein R3B70_39345 [Polyangiaceae bacterium]
MKLPRASMIILLAAMALASCGRARHTTKLAYPGKPEATLAPIEAEIAAQGYKPVCKDGEYCHFLASPDVRVHFKVAKKNIVLLVDVLNAKDMPEGKVAELTAGGERVGHAIWEKASAAAVQRERDAEAQAKAEQARKAEEDARKAEAEKNKPASSGVSLNDVMSAVGQVQISTGNGAGAQQGGGGPVEMVCCINKAFYACPDAGALDKCSGETAACMAKCMSSSDMGCPDRCLKDHPPDPSRCSRAPSRDGECK